MSSTALRLFNTVRHLKPVQVYARVQRKLARVRPNASAAPPLREAVATWVTPPVRPVSLALGWQVRFLNHDGEIARPEQWNDPAQSKLWLYNLHYFDDLLAADGEMRRDTQRALIKRWIVENPPPHGNGWEPYPVSLRIVNWIKWHLTGEPLELSMLDSIAMQVRWLSGQVEWHLLGNHVLANAKALVFAGLFFNGSEGDSWLRQGLSIYRRELPEQILGDGAHFELSPMYHAIILEDLLDLVNLSRHYGRAGDPVLRDLPELTQRMRIWLAAMTHPDGGPAFFNDAAFGIAVSRDELEAYADRLGLPPIAAPGEGLQLFGSGYVRVNVGDMAAILDVALIGPDYIPGHAHADTLSFELSLGSERVIVNSGTSTYAPSVEREAQRATRAHNTVEIDGENSSEVWAAFRVARRARITSLTIRAEPPYEVRGSHDGYRRLRGRNIHTRTWRMAERTVAVEDEVSGSYRTAIARFHLAPSASIKVRPDGKSGRITTGNGRAITWQTSAPAATIASNWYPEFGICIATQGLAIPLDGGVVTTRFEW
jgi:uncharacterized heparinase superfamily protein